MKYSVLAKDHKRSLGCVVSSSFSPHKQRFSYLGSCFLQGSHQSLIFSFPFFPQTRTLSKSGWPKTDWSWVALRKWKCVQELCVWASSLYAFQFTEMKVPITTRILCLTREHSKGSLNFTCSNECMYLIHTLKLF